LSEAQEKNKALVRRFIEDLTADCDEIDPYALHKHTSPRCGCALINRSEARQADGLPVRLIVRTSASKRCCATLPNC
jgi:hypothetical protein